MRRAFYTSALTAILATTMLTACSKEENKDSPVIAVVNGTKIHAEQVAGPLATIPANLRQGREAQLRDQVLNQLIQRELVLQAGNEANLKNDDFYKKRMAELAENLLYELTLQKAIDKGLTQELMAQHYEATKQQRAFPAAKARHILVKTEQEAKDIIKVATPENFAELAKEKSEGPSAPNGGDLGWFRKEAMVPAFAEVAFKTKPGTVAQSPVQTQFGWHVVFVENMTDTFVPPIQTVAGQLRQELSQQIAQKYLEDLRASAKITFPQAEANNAEAAK